MAFLYATAMRPRLVALLAIMVVFAATGVALASRVEVGASFLKTFKGSDRFGRVSFKLVNIETASASRHPIETLTVRQFRFANECSRKGTTVPGKMVVGRHGRFHSTARGFKVTGRLTGAQQERAVGTAQVNKDCDGDSDLVHFTAKVS
jgi:hypothetical protein